MKKLFIYFCFALGVIQIANAQKAFGIKAGLNYNATGNLESIKAAGLDIASGAKAKTGYHAGLWFRANLPVVGLYIRPEVVYTASKSEYQIATESPEYSLQKIDIPVLFGTKVLGLVHAYVGPSFQYILDSDFDISQITDIETGDISLGMQLGAGIEYKKLGIDVRWEKGLSSTESKILTTNINIGDISIDNRADQLIFSLYYRFGGN